MSSRTHTVTLCRSSDAAVGECCRNALTAAEFHDVAQCTSPFCVRIVRRCARLGPCKRRTGGGLYHLLVEDHREDVRAAPMPPRRLTSHDHLGLVAARRCPHRQQGQGKGGGMGWCPRLTVPCMRRRRKLSKNAVSDRSRPIRPGLSNKNQYYFTHLALSFYKHRRSTLCLAQIYVHVRVKG